MGVEIGESAQTFKLLIDTGSSNTWIGAHKKYSPSSSSHDTRNPFEVSYGSGMCSGSEFIDTCKLGDKLVIEKQSIGVAKHTRGFDDGIDGILGIGPVDLTSGTVGRTSSVPTVTDNLCKQGTIKVESIGCYYAPTDSDKDLGAGELTFGGSDPSKFTGEMTYVPITKTSPASKYWGVDQEICYGSDTIMNKSAGIVDTGTTLVLLPSDAFEKYQEATGAKMDRATGLLCVTEEQYHNMKSLNFKIGDTTMEMTNNAQIWPRNMNQMLGGDSDKIYLVCADIGSIGGQGLDFINGFAFLQRCYTEYDTTNARIGFACTAHTMDESN
ncbi:aspartic peptidase domain-containing protein [Mucidula mucida]|nr:aspartic peptidase domain-containing protein [Mucidula mucida]